METSSSSIINSSLTGNTLFAISKEDVNLGIGAPDEVILSQGVELYRKACQHCFENPAQNNSWLQYGPARGSSHFLGLLASWLTLHYPSSGAAVRSEQLFLTSGATSGLSLTCTLFGLSNGGTVFMEDPVYFIAGSVFDDHRMVKVPVKTDGNGIDIGDLEAKFSSLPEQQQQQQQQPRKAGQYAALLYLVPTFHNPTGVVLSLEKRQRIVDLAFRHNVLVLCDDVYDLLGYSDDDPLPPRMFSLDQLRGHVISNGSFSKIFGPGVRLGWLEASPQVIERFAESGIAASGGSLNHLTSGAMSSMLSLGYLDQMLRLARETYGAKLKIALETLRREMPPGVTLNPPSGGFFIWIRLPEKVDAGQLLQTCKIKDKVGFQPGNWSSITGGFRHYIRISFSFYDAETLAWGITRIAHHLKKLL